MRYDAKCYYKNKNVGRCTISDAESFEYLMQTEQVAAIILMKYAYFSEELQKIFEKCKAMDEKDGYSCPDTARAEWRS